MPVKCLVIENVDNELLCTSQEPYYIARFYKVSNIVQKPLIFKNGEELRVGKYIAYLNKGVQETCNIKRKQYA